MTDSGSPREAPLAPAFWGGRRAPRLSDPFAGIVIAVNLVVSGVYAAVLLPQSARTGFAGDALAAYGPLNFGWISAIVAAPAALAFVAWMLLRGFTRSLSTLALVLAVAASLGLGGPLLVLHFSGNGFAAAAVDGVLLVVVLWLVVDAIRRRRAERTAGLTR